MRLAFSLLLLLSILSLALKLFTCEAYLVDEATVGIVVRGVPSLESECPLSTHHAATSARFLIRDENDYVGSGIYSWAVQAGWLALPLLTSICAVWFAMRQRRGSTAHSS